MLEKNITQVYNAVTLLQRNMGLLLGSVLHAQVGKVQPQVVAPKILLESLGESQASFTRDSTLPFTLSADLTSLVYKVFEVHYVQLTYTVWTQLMTMYGPGNAHIRTQVEEKKHSVMHH
jgi:hypothetical protein